MIAVCVDSSVAVALEDDERAACGGVRNVCGRRRTNQNKNDPRGYCDDVGVLNGKIKRTGRAQQYEEEKRRERAGFWRTVRIGMCGNVGMSV